VIRLLRPWLVPCRISVRGALRAQWRLRPLWLLLGWLAPLLLALTMIGYWQMSFTREHARLVQRSDALQQQNEQLKERLARAEAQAMVAGEQARQLQAELAQQQRETEPLRERLSLLEEILLKRRGKGTHVLSASASWQNSQLQIRIILVKSGNYPREVRGKITILAPDPQGTALPVGPAVDYRMKTHAILHPSFHWTHDWRPRQLFVSLQNEYGRELERITVWIGGKHDHTLSTVAPTD